MYDSTSGPSIASDPHTKKMAKKRNPVYLLRREQDFQVKTDSGILVGQTGDFLAYDPISGHVWPVSSDYVAMHYEDF